MALGICIAGTTRDVIRQAIQIRGVPLHIMDTAGLRVSQDEVESLGIALTHQTLRRADLILLLLDASQGMTALDEAIIKSLPADIPRLLVLNKFVRLHGPSGGTGGGGSRAGVSAKTGE